MTTMHHPSDETLMAFASGTLDLGRRIVVGAHIEMCPSCRRTLRALDHLAGENLDALPPTQLASEAVERVLMRTSAADDRPARPPASGGGWPVAPRSLEPYELGRWKWIGPGVHWRSASVPSEGGARVFLLKAAPGTRLPHHTHTGTELTLILQGAFRHVGGHYGVGDLDEADGSIEHQPIVEPGEDCICLVAMEGNLRLLGPLGRILQPFVRM
jgi:putative transcriptional regulator